MKACVFKSRSGTRAAFLANFDTKNSVTVMDCDLTLWSIGMQYSSCFHQWSIIRFSGLAICSYDANIAFVLFLSTYTIGFRMLASILNSRKSEFLAPLH
ncbi:hypothetical protein V6N13_107313 [Hibiscus sabdariffa]|uniref:Uncharacterized protein n=1 Tax=Hibiscus sabdariffa TaxID=183260 RepID=A0ABR2SPW2_9ROSI